MKKILMVFSLVLLIALGVTIGMLYFQQNNYVTSKTINEVPKTTVRYTDVLVKEFKKIGELYFYEEKLEFNANMKSDEISDLDVVNWLYYKKADVKVVGTLKAGIDLEDLNIEEDDENIKLSFSKKEIIKLFSADKEKSSLKVESGWFSKDYDAEEVTLLWADIERQGAEKELDESQMKEVIKDTDAIENLVKSITKTKKEVTVEITD